MQANHLKKGENAPTLSSDTARTGQIAFDANYLYIAVDENSWKRIALSSF